MPHQSLKTPRELASEKAQDATLHTTAVARLYLHGFSSRADLWDALEAQDAAYEVLDKVLNDAFKERGTGK